MLLFVRVECFKYCQHFSGHHSSCIEYQRTKKYIVMRNLLLISQAMNVQWSVMMNQNFFHPHPVDGIMFTITTLYMEFVGGQEFWSRKKPYPFGCLRPDYKVIQFLPCLLLEQIDILITIAETCRNGYAA